MLVDCGDYWLRSQEHRALANIAGLIIWITLTATSIVHFAFGSNVRGSTKSPMSAYASMILPLALAPAPQCSGKDINTLSNRIERRNGHLVYTLLISCIRNRHFVYMLFTLRPVDSHAAPPERRIRGCLPHSGTCMPRPTILYVPLSSAVVKLLSHDDALEKLHALIAQLRFHSQPNRRPVRNVQIPSVYAIREKGLRTIR